MKGSLPSYSKVHLINPPLHMPPLHLPMPVGNRPEGASGKLCPFVIDQMEHQANALAYEHLANG